MSVIFTVAGFKSLIPLSVFFLFPVFFWCRFYPRFFFSAKGIWELKKAQF